MAMRGAWLARTPMEPVVVRVETISTSSSNTFPSGVRTSTGKLLRGILVLARPARRLDHLVDRALQQEGPLRDVVVLALDDLLEGAHRLLDRHVLALGPRKRLRHEERLRQEALHLARPLHGHAVLVRQLVDAEDRDDVLQLLVALQDLAHLVRDLEVLVADDVRLEDRGGR